MANSRDHGDDAESASAFKADHAYRKVEELAVRQEQSVLAYHQMLADQAATFNQRIQELDRHNEKWHKDTEKRLNDGDRRMDNHDHLINTIVEQHADINKTVTQFTSMVSEKIEHPMKAFWPRTARGWVLLLTLLAALLSGAVGNIWDAAKSPAYAESVQKIVDQNERMLEEIGANAKRINEIEKAIDSIE